MGDGGVGSPAPGGFRAVTGKAPAVFLRGEVAEKGPDMPDADELDLAGPALGFGIPQEAAQVIGVELDGAGAFAFRLLG